ncbi:MAG: hypothetical protein HYS12_19885 [Planctomycetes bacterium]|nr:hypothetical protein [Planctomycetota bacterium]
MSTFQLDKCSSSHRIVEACRKEGHGDAVLLPRHLENLEDADLVPVVMTGSSLFVTNDRRLPIQCAALIPDANPGIVLVTNYPRRHQTLTVPLMLRLFGQIKARVPDWHQFSLNNNILEITAEGVGVGHVQSGVYIFDGYFEFMADDWPSSFLSVLQTNAARFPPRLSSP